MTTTPPNSIPALPSPQTTTNDKSGVNTNTPGSGNSIQVVCRFRPTNKLELESGGSNVIEFDDDGKGCKLLVSDHQPYRFTFDSVFSTDSRQIAVFNFVGKPIVEALFQGYNGTIFVYGQTGSGKTFTMMGPNATLTGYCDDPEYKGLIPRIVEAIFSMVEQADENIEFSIKVSYIEIYLEKIRDLFDSAKTNLQLKEDYDGGRGVFVSDVTESYVSSTDEVFSLMREGSSNRTVASTRMNEESSRSHSIFTITINQKHLVTLESKSGKLFLVDLAGSEKVAKTGAQGQQLEEAKNINKSLSALGNVINSLTDGKSTHIPYRDSKLTRLLQDSLGGNSRTTLIINASTNSYNSLETLSTLRFGNRAKNIKNKAQVNRQLSVRELQILLDKSNKEITTLKQIIAGLEDEIRVLGGTPSTPRTPLTPNSMEISSRTQPPATPTLPNIKALADQIAELEREKHDLELECNKLTEDRDIQADQLQEKREELQRKQIELETLENTVIEIKQLLLEAEKENEYLVNSLADVTFAYEKMKFESKEKTMTVQSLTAANDAMSAELQTLKSAVIALRSQLEARPVNTLAAPSIGDVRSVDSIEELDPVLSTWQKQKKEKQKEEEEFNRHMQERIHRMEEIGVQGARAELESAAPPRQQSSDRERELCDRIKQLEDTVQSLYHQLGGEEKAHTIPDAHEETLADDDLGDLPNDVPSLKQQMKTLRQRLLETEEEHRREVERKNTEVDKLREDFQWKMAKMEANYKNQMSFLGQREREIKSEKETVEKEKVEKLRETEQENERLRKDIKKLQEDALKQRKEFEQLREALLHDLQNRCEKVIDLEMSLDEAREEYRQLLLSTSSKALKKKVALLEKNNEQINASYQQLYNANSSLRLELQLAEKKLAIRNDRIHNLEFLLEDAKEMAKHQSDAYQTERTKFLQEIEHYRNELSYMQENIMKLSQASSSSSAVSAAAGSGSRGSGTASGDQSPQRNRSGSNPHIHTNPRIVKPLRGGGGGSKRFPALSVPESDDASDLLSLTGSQTATPFGRTNFTDIAISSPRPFSTQQTASSPSPTSPFSSQSVPPLSLATPPTNVASPTVNTPPSAASSSKKFSLSEILFSRTPRPDNGSSSPSLFHSMSSHDTEFDTTPVRLVAAVNSGSFPLSPPPPTGTGAGSQTSSPSPSSPAQSQPSR